ncbi:hypothetical protein MRB53_014535 [Persea americana]|uniref:Uncharacterized protein n=1 Tax=Persea americana TaxID=3435 RepID=A0ACC2KB57_PERAE|nr:hypothetical protein MRB53_014535 [Persea americana]
MKKKRKKSFVAGKHGKRLSKRDPKILFCYEMDEDMEFFFFCAQTVALICVLGYYYSYGQRDRGWFVWTCWIYKSSRDVRRLYGTYGGVLSGGAVRERIIRAFLVEE